MISVGAEIRPEEPGPWVEIAAIHARKGKAGRKKALEALRTAAGKGLADPAALDREAFNDLRQDEEFRQILARVAGRKGAG